MMPHNTEPNETLQVVKGFLLLMLLHGLAGGIIFIVGFAVGSIFGNYTFLTIWVVGAMGFLFWQLLYVIPLTLWLKRRGKVGMMKGVIIGASLTALVNGMCFLTMMP